MKVYLSDLNITIPQLITKIEGSEAKKFGVCSIEDFMPDVTLTNGCGIYLFYEGTQLEYIGKSGGRNILERLGGHIDHRAVGGIMNYYLRMLAVKRIGEWKKHESWQITYPSDQSKQKALNEVRNFLKDKFIKVIYVTKDFQANCLDELESVLSAFLKPQFQKCKELNPIWGNQNITEMHAKWAPVKNLKAELKAERKRNKKQNT